MRYLLLLLFSPLCLFAVTCTIVSGENYNGEVVIHCVGDSGGGMNDQTNILSVADCEELKDDVLSVLNRAEGDVRSAGDTLMDIYHDNLGSLIMRAIDIQHEAEAISPPTLRSTNIVVMSVQLESQLDSLGDDLVTKAQTLYADADDIQALARQVDSYACNDQNCGSSGSGGSVSCPCQEEFNRILSSLGTIHEQLGQIEMNTWSNNLICSSISAQLTIMSDSLSSITNRLNAPDDRMWGELEQIYANMTSNLNTIAKSSLDLQSIFYSIRQLIRGDSGSKLNLTTEGVVSLADVVLSMQGNLQNQYNLSQIDLILRSYTNEVLHYFSLFKNAVFRKLTVPFDASKVSYLYNAFTNSSLSPQQRFINLSSTGSVTNWFNRMELYQQALLGWFDTPLAETDFEQNQSELTESSLDLALNDTTNNLGEVVNVSSNLASFVSSSGGALRDAFSGSEINASIPSQLTILPELTVMGETFGPVVFDTSPYESTLDFVRDCTTLLWKFSFYVLVLLVIWITARKAYLLVLYIVHIMQNL